MDIPVTKFRQVHAFGLKQGRGGFKERKGAQALDLYLGVLPAVSLVGRVKVDVKTHANPDGYQRPLSETRAKAISRYVRNDGGLMPTAILVNIRGSYEFIETGGRQGILRIPDGETFWVEDGQHRSMGLKHAGETGFDTSMYEVPVVFTTLSVDEERKLFLVVNKEAKSVPTDLTAELIGQDIMERIGDGERPSILDIRKAVGVYVAQRLAREPGPWCDRLRTAAETKAVAKEKPVGTATFASTLRPALMDRWAQRRYEPGKSTPDDWNEIYNAVRNYWLALESLMPKASADTHEYSLRKPIGVYCFHQIMPEFLDLARQENDFSAEFFTDKLSHLGEWVEDEQWDTTAKNNREPMVKANNRATIEMIVARMKDNLREAGVI
jgi:DGQHR domain-containing protein